MPEIQVIVCPAAETVVLCAPLHAELEPGSPLHPEPLSPEQGTRELWAEVPSASSQPFLGPAPKEGSEGSARGGWPSCALHFTPCSARQVWTGGGRMHEGARSSVGVALRSLEDKVCHVGATEIQGESQSSGLRYLLSPSPKLPTQGPHSF